MQRIFWLMALGFTITYTGCVGTIRAVGLYGCAQNGSAPFDLYYRDVRISTVGFSTP